jgi:hypothetical protein
MEDVLEVYARPYNPARPVVCFDEKSKQLLEEVRPSLPALPGKVAKEDYEYQRNGTRNLFVMVEPLAGWRKLEVTARRTRQDYAHQMKWLVDERYAEAEVVVVVQDNLNTHDGGSLYETFPPEEAERILKKLEFHFTPKHGSWLNMAEIELSVFERQCLSRRIGDEATLKKEVALEEAERNRCKAKINWQFTTVKARQKMQRVYPKLT